MVLRSAPRANDTTAMTLNVLVPGPLGFRCVEVRSVKFRSEFGVQVPCLGTLACGI